MYDIIVIGAGPAGMTAAIYGRRASKSVLLLEARSFGGQIINAHRIENYPAEPGISGVDYAMKLYEQTNALGAEFKFERALSIRDGEVKTVVTASGEYQAKTVIIATGSDNGKLGLPNEAELTGRGVSYCATCDGAFFKGKTVAVAAGNAKAYSDAVYLSDIAQTVYLIDRDPNGGKGQTEGRDNIKVISDSRVTKLIADKRLTAIEVTDSRGGSREIELDGLFVSVGRVPENQSFEELIDLDSNGYAASEENCLTRTAGIFVAGDNRAKTLRQLVTAASDGAVAATQAVKYIAARK
ncbi:MAG: FAD-dependent oxidoreductase [Ruminococcus sp.]|nr:FAD-dependent oxidoreductase [Ruminococcus sp.]